MLNWTLRQEYICSFLCPMHAMLSLDKMFSVINQIKILCNTAHAGQAYPPNKYNYKQSIYLQRRRYLDCKQ